MITQTECVENAMWVDSLIKLFKSVGVKWSHMMVSCSDVAKGKWSAWILHPLISHGHKSLSSLRYVAFILKCHPEFPVGKPF